MQKFVVKELTKLYKLPKDSHKGQNGRLMIIGGSHLFHAASIWALEVASRIVDLVHYSSTPENNEIVKEIKKQFRDGIIIPREQIEDYIQEDDCILIGPGMVRAEGAQVSKCQGIKVSKIAEINEIKNEGEQTAALTNYLLAKYPSKQWVIDAGALQMVDLDLIPPNTIITPHHGEFELLWEKYQKSNIKNQIDKANLKNDEDKVKSFAKFYRCIILLKGLKDIAYSPNGEGRVIEGGNSGMTKGGTGDVLAGLVAALACKNDPFLSACAASLINKQAGDELYQKQGPYFNASDLTSQIPLTMHKIIGT